MKSSGMALKRAVDRANISQLCFGIGLTTFILALTLRRLREEHLARHKPSKRSKELTGGGTPAHLLEHIARLDDPDYVCLAIAENKLTVGPLLDKLLELAARPRAPEQHDTEPPAPPPPLPGGEQQPPGPVAADTVISSDNSTAGETINTSASTTTATVGGPHETGVRATTVSAAEAEAEARLASMGYGDQRGPLWVRREIADLMGERMFHRRVDPNNLCVAAGATSVLRLLLLAVTERGQGCLIPGPYFPGFDKVLTSAGVRACVANRVPAGGGGVEGGIDEGISPRVLQAGLRTARVADVEVRVLLITSPHNPTGRLYSAKALLAAVAWARKRGLHIVVDEVYANCVHRPNAPFRSAGNLLTNVPGGMGNDVHIMYGFSKDLGVAGWRVGVLYSENKEVMTMVLKMVHTSQASSDTMDLVGRLLREPGFIDGYFRQHQEGLRAAYVSLVNQLGRKGIMHLQAEAGLFVMLDLREFLDDSSEEAEAKLWRQMLDRTGVNLTPGGAFHCVEPGWFRLCFAYQKIEVVSRCVERLADFLQALVQERAANLEREEEQGALAVVAASGPPSPPPAGAAAAAAAAAAAGAAGAAVGAVGDEDEDDVSASDAATATVAATAFDAEHSTRSLPRQGGGGGGVEAGVLVEQREEGAPPTSGEGAALNNGGDDGSGNATSSSSSSSRSAAADGEHEEEIIDEAGMVAGAGTGVDPEDAAASSPNDSGGEALEDGKARPEITSGPVADTVPW